MKTAGQEFLEWYNDYVKQYGCSPSDYDVNYFWEHNYLELEKQQIMDAWLKGVEDEGNPHGHTYLYGETDLAKQYYKETFNLK